MKLETIIKVTCALVEKYNKFYLIKEMDTKRNIYRWNLIKGTFDFATDQNFEDAMKREIKEEVGLDIGVLKFLKPEIKIDEKKATVYINFFSNISDINILDYFGERKNMSDEDIIEIKGFTYKEIFEMDDILLMSPMVKKNIQKLADILKIYE